MALSKTTQTAQGANVAASFVQIADIVSCTAGQTIRIMVSQDSGNTLTSSGTIDSRVSISQVH
jgi:hypothetical protein